MKSQSLPWFRMYHELIDDDKVLSLAFEDRWHYVALTACKAKGILDRPQDEAALRRALCIKLGVDGRTLDEIERRLVDVNLVEGGTFQPVAWEKRQFRSDADPTNAKRQAKHREKQSALRNGSVTGLDTDTEDIGAGAPISVGKHAYTAEFEQAWKSYPDRPGCNKLESFKAWNARLKQHATADLITAGVRRYAAYCRAMKIEPRFIKQPATFFGPNEHFMEEWRVPVVGVGQTGNRVERAANWNEAMTGNHGGQDDRPDDFIDVEARRV